MKLSTRARYALSCMIAVARLSEEETPVSLERVAKTTRVSRRYLEQLVLPLKNQRLLHSVSGRRGGYRLARDAGDIRLREIVEAAIGPISIVDCVAAPGVCEKAEACENRLLYLLVNARICEVLDEYRLADLADQVRLTEICSSLNQDSKGEMEPAGQEPDIARLCTRILADCDGAAAS
jgi:Rrf2 family protein